MRTIIQTKYFLCIKEGNHTMVLSHNMKIARKAAGLSQSELGENIGRGMRSIIHYESGERTPPGDVIQKWANATGVSVEQLYSEETLTMGSHTQKGTASMETSTVNTLLDRIETLSAKVRDLEHPQPTKLQTLLDQSVDFHCKISMQLNVSGEKLKRTVISVEGWDNLVQYLGYSKTEMERYWDINNEHLMDNQSVNDILTNATLVKLTSIREYILPTIKLGQNGYSEGFHLSIPLVFRHKNGEQIYSMCSNTLDFNSLILESQIIFVEQEKN